jgi:hypothetical protein
VCTAGECIPPATCDTYVCTAGTIKADPESITGEDDATCCAGATYSDSTCGGGAAGVIYNTNLITDEATCRAAAAIIGRPFADVAGPEWESGCLVHGGNAYFSPVEDGSGSDPTDGYICGVAAGAPYRTFDTCAAAGLITDEATCSAAAEFLGAEFGDSPRTYNTVDQGGIAGQCNTQTGTQWSPALYQGGQEDPAPACQAYCDGTQDDNGLPCAGFIWRQSDKSCHFQSGTLAPNAFGDAGHKCYVAQAVAASEWESGCLFQGHTSVGGNAYFSPVEDGSTNNPADFYICQEAP